MAGPAPSRTTPSTAASESATSAAVRSVHAGQVWRLPAGTGNTARTRGGRPGAGPWRRRVPAGSEDLEPRLLLAHFVHPAAEWSLPRIGWSPAAGASPGVAVPKVSTRMSTAAGRCTTGPAGKRLRSPHPFARLRAGERDGPRLLASGRPRRQLGPGALLRGNFLFRALRWRCGGPLHGSRGGRRSRAMGRSARPPARAVDGGDGRPAHPAAVARVQAWSSRRSMESAIAFNPASPGWRWSPLS